MAKKRRPFNIKTRFICQMRRQWWYSPERQEALRLARTKRGLYKCAISKKLFPIDQVTVDHIKPVVDPFEGFEGYDRYMERLFCPVEGLQVISKAEHQKKTEREKKIRDAAKKAKAK